MGEYPGLEHESIAEHDKALGRRVFEEGARAGRDIGVEVVLLPPDQFEETRKARNVLEDYTGYRKQCHDLWNRAVIAATGDVLPCCAAPRPLGNLGEQSFEEIWRGDAYNALRRAFLGGDPPEMCRQCTGTAWVRASARRDVEFYLGSLLLPRVKRRAKRRLKQYAAARWTKRQWDSLRGRAHDRAADRESG
jgi:radical SAM protein with 4Fe4S-binding SPASM domain